MTSRWRKQPGIELHWRDWGADSVVFEQRSGATHQFPPLTAAVMACFEQGELGYDALAAGIAGDLGIAATDLELRAGLNASVAQLLKLGWIEPIIPA